MMGRGALYGLGGAALLLLLWLLSPSEQQAKSQPEPTPPPVAEVSQTVTTAAIQLPPPPPLPIPKAVPVLQPLKPQAKPVTSDVTPLKPSPAKLKPQPVKRERLKSKPSNQSKPELRPAGKPARQGSREPTIRADNRANRDVVAEGRVMLRMLEHGKGPVIEIAWPQSASARRAIFEQLNRCFGMMLAVMDGEGRLYRAADQAGQPWSLNMDRVSGFLRAPYGQLTTVEHRADQAIRDRHGLPNSAQGVRLFPRHVDARMLGGLRAVVGSAEAQRIQARYQPKGSKLFITDIRVNGEARPGRIDLGVCR